MRAFIVAIALTFASPVVAQIPPTPATATGPGVQKGAPAKKPSPSVSAAEADKKLGEANQAKREATDAAKQKAWDAKMKRAMSGICRGC
jgi:hypothetical protein